MKFRHTNFMRLIYATLLALPFVAILSRVIYVQSNKNAYQSAEITSNTQQAINNLPTNEVNSFSDLIIGNYYEIQFTTEITQQDTYIDILNDSGVGNFEILNYKTDNDNSYSITYKENYSIVDYLSISTTTLTNGTIISSDDTNDISCLEVSITNITSINNYILIKCLNLTGVPQEYIEFYHNVEHFQDYTINNVQATTLDNVFEFSVNKFIQNNNFGKINLFQWTTNLFFDSNDVNNMYVGFINWYLNYTLLVSATYILFLVLMWFINYARRLLERGMNYDW